ncbi:nuclear transport factor 2 family protein [Rhodococcus sp. LB1]|uniref:nuclear transport factor 2 family protein n=1 Tax=Rhodococcus sp. LB1 TaxID=1807499 RepID=UPI0018D3309D|nr:nuclear transport factor 2 family protein [Rhodococcus sp. LB1]
MNEQLRELLDREQIRELLARLARSLDRVHVQGILDCYAKESTNDYGAFIASGAEFAARPSRQSLNNVATNHLLGQSVIELAGDVALCETYFRAITVERIDEDLRQTDLAGRYLDRVERLEGIWQLVERVVRMDWVSSQPVQGWAAMSRFGQGSRWPDDLVYTRAEPGKP